MQMLATMSGIELKAIIQHASLLRNQRSSRFLEMPPELRNRIYQLAVTPEVIETHVMTGQAPALLKVNRQVSTEFASLYYSCEFMAAEFHNPLTGDWDVVKHSTVFRAMLRKRPGCKIRMELVPVEGLKKRIISTNTAYPSEPKTTMAFRTGVFSWCSLRYDGEATWCCFFADAQDTIEVHQCLKTPTLIPAP